MMNVPYEMEAINNDSILMAILVMKLIDDDIHDRLRICQDSVKGEATLFL